MTIAYIAYGSNLHPLRIGERCNARFVRTGTLPRRQLVFHKRGDGPSGKCNIPITDNPDHAVYVAVYHIPEDEKLKLDEVEGLGKGYHEEMLEVQTDAGLLTGVAYVADENAIDSTLAPFDWYKEMVVLGAEYHDFPPEYRKNIGDIASIPDGKQKRAATRWAMVEKMKHANTSRRPPP